MNRHRQTAVTLLSVGLAALVGGTAGAAVFAASAGVSKPGLLTVLVLLMTLFCVLVAAPFVPRSPNAVPPVAYGPPQVAPQAPGYAPTPAPSAAPAPAPTAGPTWYAAAAQEQVIHDPPRRPTTYAGPVAGPAPTPPPAASQPRFLDLPLRADGLSPTNGAGARRIVQCPRCADFAVDVQPDHAAFGFGCRACGHRWTWHPEAAWPVTVVRPRLGQPETRAR